MKNTFGTLLLLFSSNIFAQAITYTAVNLFMIENAGITITQWIFAGLGIAIYVGGFRKKPEAEIGKGSLFVEFAIQFFSTFLAALIGVSALKYLNLEGVAISNLFCFTSGFALWIFLPLAVDKFTAKAGSTIDRIIGE
jgi:hypothetical protein